MFKTILIGFGKIGAGYAKDKLMSNSRIAPIDFADVNIDTHTNVPITTITGSGAGALVKIVVNNKIKAIDIYGNFSQGLKNEIQQFKSKYPKMEANYLTEFEKRLAIDYQLQRAIDLIRGVSLYKETLQ